MKNICRKVLSEDRILHLPPGGSSLKAGRSTNSCMLSNLKVAHTFVAWRLTARPPEVQVGFWASCCGVVQLKDEVFSVFLFWERRRLRAACKVDRSYNKRSRGRLSQNLITNIWPLKCFKYDFYVFILFVLGQNQLMVLLLRYKPQRLQTYNQGCQPSF